MSSVLLRAASHSFLDNSSESLTVTMTLKQGARQEEGVQGKQQQRLLKDILPDAFPFDLERYEKPPSETPPPMEGMQNGLLPPGARKDQLEAAYKQRRQALWVAFIQENHQARSVFDESHVNFMLKRAWLVQIWPTLRGLGALRD